jgi:hypothetical protein
MRKTKTPKAPKTPTRAHIFNRVTFIQRSRGVSSEEKAMYHNVTGAGTSHVRRVFFDLSPEDAALCQTTLHDALVTRMTPYAQ